MKTSGSTLAATFAAGVIFCAGCASNNVQVQWTDPAFAGQSLRGEKVLVVCDASEAAVKRLCQEQMTARLGASGAIVVGAAEAEKLTGGASPISDNTLAAARTAGAKAIWSATVAPDTTVASAGPTVGFGVGGFGSSGAGGGVGVSIPVGSGRVDTAYGANLVLTDVATGRMMWTSKVTTPASRDIAGQVGKLAQTGVEAAQKAGML